MTTTSPQFAGYGFAGCECDNTRGQACPDCDGSFAEQYEAAIREENARGPLPDSAPRICDASGLIAVLATDGEGYDWLACLGCAACRSTVSRDAEIRAEVTARGAFARIPDTDDEKEW